MSISTSLRRSWREVTARCWNWGYFGEDPTGIAPQIACFSGESVMALNTANSPATPATAPTGLVPLIGLNASDLPVLPVGTSIGTLSASTLINTSLGKSYMLDAAEAVSRTAHIARQAEQVTGVAISFGVASSSGTFTIEKLTGTTAPGSGTVMLTGTLSTAGTANTVAAGVLVATASTLQLAVGDRVGLVFSGTETGLVGLCVELTLNKI